MIFLHEKTGSFCLDLPHIRASSLLSRGWLTTKSGKRIYTKDVDLALIDEDLFCPELRELFVSHVRQPLKLDDATWERIVPHDKTLYEHQKATVEWTVGASDEFPHTIDGNPPGAGKTAIAVVVSNYDDPDTWLIVCPASVKYNWLVEINEWTVEPRKSQLHVEVCENKTADEHIARILAARAEGKKVIVIINYDILARFEVVMKESWKWDRVTYDESHRFKNLYSNRTQFCLDPKDGIPVRRAVFASATKLDRPYNLWPTLTFVEPHRLGADEEYFINRYCSDGTLDYKGNLDKMKKNNVRELGQLLGESCFVRFDIDHLLPPYREETVYLPPSPMVAEAEIALFDEILNGDTEGLTSAQEERLLNLRAFLRSQLGSLANMKLDEIPDSERVRVFGETFIEQAEFLYGIPVVFEKMAEMRRITGMAKLQHLIDHIKLLINTEDSGEVPLVVMVHHKDIVDALMAEFGDIARKVVGGVSAKRRQVIKEDFQAGKFPLFIGNISAAGEGITLTRSCRLLFGEIDWSASSMWQALKRIHRLTQLEECLIQYLLLQNSMDALLAKTYIGKRETISEFFAGVDDVKSAEV